MVGPGTPTCAWVLALDTAARERTEEHYEPSQDRAAQRAEDRRANGREGPTVAGVPGAISNLPDNATDHGGGRDDGRHRLVVFCCTSVLISRRLELGRPRVGRLARTALAALLMGVGLGLLRLVGAPLGALIAFACAAYPALLFSLRVLGADDVRVLIKRGSPA